MKREIFALIIAAAVSLTAVPQGVAALSPEGSEYLVRLATGSLYVPYTFTDKPYEAEETVEESVEALSRESHDESLAMPDNAIAVQAVNLSRLEAGDPPKLYLINETDYSVDLDAMALTPQRVQAGAVLIVHTHGTEAYLPDGVEYYTEDEDFRSTDNAENVVAVGEVFAQALRSAGITVYHDTTLFDADSFSSAYTSSRKACRSWLAEHPEISYIIDIHRDAVTDSDGLNQKPLCTVNGQSVAQVMLVIGTDEAGATHGDWRTNLGIGAKYQQLLNQNIGFARPIYLRRASYNQQLSSGGMLLEIGSGANTITEAKAAASLAGQAFVQLYKELSQ